MANEVATTILNQLGGVGRLSVMVGAKQFVAGDNGVHFSLGRFTGVKVREVGIYVNGSDLYDMWFRDAKGNAIASESDVFCGDLKRTIEAATGLALSLGGR